MQEDQHLVSIIMPCYNAGAFLHAAISSVLNQTYRNFELIIINDGSTDDSLDIIKSFKDDRIRYHYQENKGQCHASNAGLSVAIGEYIKFMDADDLMNEDHIGPQVRLLQGRSDALACCAWGRFYNNDISTVSFLESPSWNSMAPIEWIKCSLSELYDMMPVWLWLIPKNVIAKAGAWNAKLSLNNDFEYSIRLLLNSTYVHFVPEAKMFYRTGHEHTVSGARSEAAYRSAFISSKLGCDHILQMDNSKEMKTLCANKYSFWLYHVYPQYPALVKDFELEIRLLGGGNRRLDESRLMHRLQKIFGWKIAKRIKMVLSKLGYEKYLLPIKKKIFPPTISQN